MEKGIKYLLILLLPFTLSAQVDPKTQPKPKDYNFVFFSEGYTLLNVSYKLDSITQKFTQHIDSTGNQSQFIISKDKNRLSISSIDPAGPDSYSELVTFTGVTPDGFLVYTGPKNTPILAVNPLMGWVVISFRDCTGPQAKGRENCSMANHYFGGAKTNILR
jgi:hypothetical protein